MTIPSDASRRDVLKVVGVGASGLAVATVVSAPRAPAVPPRAAAPAQGEPTLELADLAGQQLGAYKVVAVNPVERGGVPVIMASASGRTFRVDVLRYDPADHARGIGAVSAVSVYLRNGGDGQTSTDEEQGLGAMALAEELIRREHAGWKPSPALLTRGERESLDASAKT